MREEIICAGFGGQGIMLLGKLIAQTAMREDFKVTWMPSYGAEVRGGTAHSMVIVSDKEIASPVVSLCDTAIVMNGPSFDKFVCRIRPKGMLIVNSSLVKARSLRKGIKIFKIPLTDIAYDLGDVRIANMAALGVYISQKRFLSKKIIEEEIKKIFLGKKKLIDLNIRALEKGVNSTAKR